MVPRDMVIRARFLVVPVGVDLRRRPLDDDGDRWRSLLFGAPPTAI